jgi:hypothetical protein
MDFWNIIQAAYLLLNFVGTGLLAVALVTVINWPYVRGRGLLVVALAVRMLAVFGYLSVGLLNVADVLGRFDFPSAAQVMQVGYMLLAVMMITGDALLLLALISLAAGLREIQARGDGSNAPPTGPPAKY